MRTFSYQEITSNARTLLLLYIVDMDLYFRSVYRSVRPEVSNIYIKGSHINNYPPLSLCSLTLQHIHLTLLSSPFSP